MATDMAQYRSGVGGYTKRFPGITGYFFLSEDLHKYRPLSEIKVPPDGFLNYKEAATMLGTRTEVVRGLVAQGVLSAPTKYRNGLSKLVSAEDLRRFAEQYEAGAALARRLNLNSRSLPYYLKESGTPVLAIPILGKGKALFALQEDAIRLQVPVR
jgi:hypothetical protein